MIVEVDLHLHTTFSDGTLTPSKLVDLCAEKGLKTISVTDHDSTEGIEEALNAAEKHEDFSIIPGIELSADQPGIEVHVLGYYLDYKTSEFQQILSDFRDGRKTRAQGIVQKLNDLGIKISWDQVLDIADGAAIGRPHIAQAMVDNVYIEYPKQAFERYLGRNGSAYVSRPRLTPSDAVQLILDHSGVPVLAHPTYLAQREIGGEDWEIIKQNIRELKNAGLVGIEVFYNDYTDDQIAKLEYIASEFQLIKCGGSDYHANGNPGEILPGHIGPSKGVVSELIRMKNLIAHNS
jgi:predicted metal-dependent phosphoesterase TrpH